MTSSFSSELKSHKADFLADGGDGWTVVMGNEAGDLDSLASALAYAWLRSHTHGRAIAHIATPREDFGLRAENIHALGLAGLSQPFGELHCSGDPMPSQSSDFALVDHNVLHSRYASPTARVVAVIDHHADEGQYTHTADPRIIEPAGSCASLVTRLLEAHPGLIIPRELSTLLLSALLIDTKCLKDGDKALDVDREAAAFLFPLSHLAISKQVSAVSDSQPVARKSSVQSLFALLREKKSDISRLSIRDLLRRDYKEYAFNVPASEDSRMIKAGLATVPLRLSEFYASSAYPLKDIHDWIAERDLDILGVLTTFWNKEGKGRRQQLWVIKAPDENVAERLWQGLESNDELALKRLDGVKFGFVGADADTPKGSGNEGVEQVSADEEQPVFGDLHITRVYKQRNANATRKQIAPILRRLIEGT